ncbi:MAG: Nif11-like leader peptide family natural product precursor [Clostridia bacterium]|nr:Nif11-like leader peptide family natural product precursor [Clostridia bacterium]
MKGLKEFLELLKSEKGILAEVEKVQDDASKVVAIAKKHGYTFTEDDYTDLRMEAVSGGVVGQELKKGWKKFKDFWK